METRADVLSTDQISIGLATALTFDDVLLVPRHSTVLPSAVDVSVAGDAQHLRQRAAAQRGDGYRHRVAPGHRHGPAGRHRHHPQEPLGRGAGVGGRSRQALRERDDRQPDHAVADQPDLRSPRPDEEVPHLGRADHRRRQQGRQAGRHPDQPRPALRDEPRSADLRHHDARSAVHRAGRHDARTGARVPAPAQGREAAGRRRSVHAQGADHRQGHPEDDHVPERVQGRARAAAGRRGHRRRP